MNDLLQAIADRLAWDLDSSTSVEIHLDARITRHGTAFSGEQSFDTIKEHYIEEVGGGRFYEMRGQSGDRVVIMSRYYSDGTRCADVQFSSVNPDQQQTIMINRQFALENGTDRRNVPAPLRAFYVGRSPLHQALPRGELLGKLEILGRPGVQVLFREDKQPSAQAQVIILDEATGIPMKIDGFRNEADRQNQKPWWTWTASSLEQINGRTFPIKSKTSNYDADGNLMLSTEYDVQSIKFNQSYAASTFWPVYQPEAMVYDNIEQRVIAEPTPKPLPPPAPPVPPVVTTKTIEAVPPADWSSTVSPLALGLGVAVLLAAGVLLWRRR